MISLFKDLVDWVDVVETPVDSWLEEECVLRRNGVSYRCVALPYTKGGGVEGEFAIGWISNGEVLVKPVLSNMVVFIEYPKEHDLAKYVVLELVRKYNVSAVVFYDRVPGLYRRIVINGSPLYSFETGSPPPVPVVSIDYSDLVELSRGNGHVEIEVKTSLKKNSLGRTVLFGINGGKEGEIHITAHHDHWFTGFSDNLSGLAVLYSLASKLKNSWRGFNIILISYTAEEIGSPGYASWYWSWGSRYYLDILQAKGWVEKVLAGINVDSLYKYPVEIYGNPVLTKCLNKVSGDKSIYKGFDNMDFDSHSYSLHGIPSLTITSIESLKPIYHSNYDDGRGFETLLIEDISRRIIEFTQCLCKDGFSIDAFRNYLINSLNDEVPLDARSLIARTASFINDTGSAREIVRRFFTTTYTLGLNQESVSAVFSDIVFLKKVLDNIDEYIGRVLETYSFNENIVYVDPRKTSRDDLRTIIVNTMIRRSVKHSRALNEIIPSIVKR